LERAQTLNLSKTHLLLIALALLLLVSGTFYINSFNAKSDVKKVDRATILFPVKVGNVTVVKALVGEKGIEAIKSIHWNPNALTGLINGSVVIYSDGSVLWISALRNASIAEELEKRMVSRIVQFQGELPYGVPIPHKVGNTTFYIIPDLRQRVHVLWREGKYLIWLQLGADGIKIFKELVKMYSSK